MGRTPGLPRAVSVCVAVLGFVTPLVPAGVSAAPSTIPSGYQISVSESAPTMVYGEQSPSFRASLTVPADEVGFNPVNFNLLIDSQLYAGTVSGSSPAYSLYVSGFVPTPPLSGGQHSVFAQYASPKNGLVTSAPVTLTVLKATPVLSCGLANYAPTFAPNTQLTITTSFSNVNAPVDWTKGTFALTFSGTQTFTVGGLAADGSGRFVATTPAVPDVYQTRCSFSGTSSVNPVEAALGTPTLIVSSNHPIGGIQLRTDPAPVRDGVSVTWNVVVLGGSGLPAPTGTIDIRVGGYFTSPIALAGGGGVTLQTNPAPGLFGTSPIRIWYSGDPVYAASGSDFPLTTSPLSGGGSAPSGAGTAPSLTTNTDSPVATPTASQTAEARPAQASRAQTDPARQALRPASLVAYGDGGRYSVGAMVLVLLIGLGGGVAWLRRRRRSASTAAGLGSRP